MPGPLLPLAPAPTAYSLQAEETDRAHRKSAGCGHARARSRTCECAHEELLVTVVEVLAPRTAFTQGVIRIGREQGRIAAETQIRVKGILRQIKGTVRKQVVHQVVEFREHDGIRRVVCAQVMIEKPPVRAANGPPVNYRMYCPM